MPDFVAPRPRAIVQAHKGRDPRIAFFYLVVAAVVIVLGVGIAVQQLFRSDVYHEKEKVQSQRRIVVPGPRGNIYDREGRLLVGNRPRFSVVLYLDELRGEFRRQYLDVRKAYRQSGDKDLPNPTQLEQIARFTVVDRYLQRVNHALGRRVDLDPASLTRHYRAQRLLPFTLLEDLSPAEYARLLEQLPVNSPLQVHASSTRHYPHDSAAAHVLGYVTVNDDVEVADDFPGAELTTFKMKGSGGRNGLEARYDEQLQGEAGGAIYRVDPAGYRVESLQKRLPIQGSNIVTSLDIDLQLAAERAMTEDVGLNGTAIALDVRTGEVLVMASKPDFNLNDFSPRLNSATASEINARGAWLNRAAQGLYPPGSTFKIITALAALRQGVITPAAQVECTGTYRVGGRTFVCNNHRDRGPISLPQSLEKSCNSFYYDVGLAAGPDAIAAEARRFGLGERTGIELPHETGRTVVPDPDWKYRTRNERWFSGDTANYSIGQGDLVVTPLQMAAMIASFARGETRTEPTLVHTPDRPPLRSPPIGLPAAAYAAMVRGMEDCTVTGTARLFQLPHLRIPDLRIAGKTGTAQKRVEGGKNANFAWFVGFAPIDNPQIAIAVMMEGDTPGEEAGGGRYAVPVAAAILKAWKAKQAAPARFLIARP